MKKAERMKTTWSDSRRFPLAIVIINIIIVVVSTPSNLVVLILMWTVSNSHNTQQWDRKKTQLNRRRRQSPRRPPSSFVSYIHPSSLPTLVIAEHWLLAFPPSLEYFMQENKFTHNWRVSLYKFIFNYMYKSDETRSWEWLREVMEKEDWMKHYRFMEELKCDFE